MSQAMVIEGKDFRRLQLLELDMLIELDRVCKANNIRYQIAGGTLLGAVRHKGFIPWDDDADVVMLREEYEKFKKVSGQLAPEICFLQDHTTDDKYRCGYGKLRRTGTEYIRLGQEHIKCKTGVFIDVFPLDDVPMSLFGQMLQDFHCFVLRKILWSEVAKKSESGFMRRWYCLLSKIPKEWVFKQLSIYTRKSRNDSPNMVRTLCYTAIGKLYLKQPIKQRYGMPKKWFTSFQEFMFEGHMLTGIKDFDECLTYEYGDYMTLPPEDQRGQHAPVSYYKF